jgi:hypothetical protein
MNRSRQLHHIRPCNSTSFILLVACSPLLQSLVQTLSQALLVLHHLIFSVQPTFILQHALEMAALHRRFNGVTHMFIVTMGRLSYSDLPKWIPGNVQVDLDQLAGM